MKKKTIDPVMTILTICVGFVGLYIYYQKSWLIQTGFIIGVLGIFSSFFREKINFLWQKLIELLSKIMPNILLGIVYYVFLFPISVLAKIFSKKDPLMLKNNHSSTFIDSEKEYTKAYFEKTW